MKKVYLLLLMFISNLSLALDLDDLKKGVEGIAKELDKNLQNEEKDNKSESVKQEAAPAPQEAAPAPQEAAPAPQEATSASKPTQKQIEKKNKIYNREREGMGKLPLHQDGLIFQKVEQNSNGDMVVYVSDTSIALNKDGKSVLGDNGKTFTLKQLKAMKDSDNALCQYVLNEQEFYKDSDFKWIYKHLDKNNKFLIEVVISVEECGV